MMSRSTVVVLIGAFVATATAQTPLIETVGGALRMQATDVLVQVSRHVLCVSLEGGGGGIGEHVVLHI
jgi:hypothetical protein